MNDAWSEVAANGICHAAQMASAEIQYSAGRHTAPSVLYRPTLSADGTMWCALFGDNLQEGIAGFGETPIAAMEAFDKAFLTERTSTATRLLREQAA